LKILEYKILLNKMKLLYKVTIRTYYFGIIHYNFYVIAESESEALKLVRETPKYKKDDDAEIVNVFCYDLKKSNSCVL